MNHLIQIWHIFDYFMSVRGHKSSQDTDLLNSLAIKYHFTYLQVSDIALTGVQTSQDDGIVGIEVGDKLTRNGGDF